MALIAGNQREKIDGRRVETAVVMELEDDPDRWVPPVRFFSFSFPFSVFFCNF